MVWEKGGREGRERINIIGVTENILTFLSLLLRVLHFLLQDSKDHIMQLAAL
jgi:hypothetical protein